MIRDGYTISHRAAWSHPVVGIADPKRCLLWKWMIDLAYFKEADGLKRGQFRATVRELAAVVGLSKSAAQRFKSDLLNAGMITVEDGPSKRSPSTWTVVNYDRFQAGHELGRKAGHETDHERDTPLPVVNGASEESRDTSGTQGGTLDGTRSGTPIEVKPIIKTPEPKTNNQPPAPGPWATGPQPASTEPLVEPPPAKDEKKPKPSVKPIGDWPGIDVDQKWKGYKFPEEFNAIWAPWLLTQKRNSNVKAIGKQNSYRLILNWLHDGLAPADVLRATKDYMREFWNDPNKTHCVHPTTFYSRANPTLPDRIAAFAGTTGPAPIRDRWHNPRDAWRECVSLANHLGAPIPDVPKRDYGALWEDVEAFHPLVIQYATDRAGFKTMPDDLAQRVRGGK